MGVMRNDPPDVVPGDAANYSARSDRNAGSEIVAHIGPSVVFRGRRDRVCAPVDPAEVTWGRANKDCHPIGESQYRLHWVGHRQTHNKSRQPTAMSGPFRGG